MKQFDSTHEHNVLELVNRVEAAIHIWRRKLQIRQAQGHVKDGRTSSKSSWGLAKDGGATDVEKKELLSERAESLLLLLRQKFPGLPQTILDVNKIQYNKVHIDSLFLALSHTHTHVEPKIPLPGPLFQHTPMLPSTHTANFPIA